MESSSTLSLSLFLYSLKNYGLPCASANGVWLCLQFLEFTVDARWMSTDFVSKHRNGPPNSHSNRICFCAQKVFHLNFEIPMTPFPVSSSLFFSGFYPSITRFLIILLRNVKKETTTQRSSLLCSLWVCVLGSTKWAMPSETNEGYLLSVYCTVTNSMALIYPFRVKIYLRWQGERCCRYQLCVCVSLVEHTLPFSVCAAHTHANENNNNHLLCKIHFQKLNA